MARSKAFRRPTPLNSTELQCGQLVENSANEVIQSTLAFPLRRWFCCMNGVIPY